MGQALGELVKFDVDGIAVAEEVEGRAEGDALFEGVLEGARLGEPENDGT